MFLEYGVTSDGELVRIDQVARGRLLGVFCPYCQRPLIARKGAIKQPHFAHDGETCAAANRAKDAISLPVFEKFNLSLTAKLFEMYQRAADWSLFQKGTGAAQHEYERLFHLGLVKFNAHNGRFGRWELTHLGKIPVGELSLNLFNKVQEPLIVKRHEDLQEAAYRALSKIDFDTHLIDLRLYGAQWRHILALALYFMEITYAGGVLHKIGVTGRTPDERAHEIAGEMRPHLGDVSIKVLGTWGHRGNVEPYFKHRYRAHAHPIGALTEYFAFPDVKPVLRDLTRMQEKALTDVERAILAGEPFDLTQGVPPEDKRLTSEQWAYLTRFERTPERLEFRDDDFRVRNSLSRFYPLLVKGRGVWEKEEGDGWSGGLTDYGRVYFGFFGAWYRQQFPAERKRAAIREGMARAKAAGRHVGRVLEDQTTFLDKPKTQAIRAALDQGLSLRVAAATTGVSVNTVRKVKAMIDGKEGVNLGDDE